MYAIMQYANMRELTRAEKERIAELIAEKRRRLKLAASRPQEWARQFEGRPLEFIGEVVGPSWWTYEWQAWRCFIRVLFGLPLEPDDADIYRQCTGLDPDQYSPHRYREAWMPVGRRGGKSRVLALVACYMALCYDWRQYLAPGQLGYVSVISDNRHHASEIMHYVKGVLEHPELKSTVVKSLVESIELNNRVSIEVVTASISAVRVRTVIAGLLDEIAFWRSEETAANPDMEILRALRPAMLTIPGAMLLGASSRYARRGVLWDNFTRYFGTDAGPLVWSADTVTMHPSVDRELIRAEYEKDPIAAAAEYGLEWRSDVAAFIPLEVLQDCIEDGVRELPPSRAYAYKAFVDPAGGSGSDSMTLAIGHLERNGSTAALDAIREVRPPFKPSAVVKEFAEVLRSYNVVSIVGDRFAGEWAREPFSLYGINYEVSERSKAEIYQAWLPLLNSGRSKLLDHDRMVAQASQLERRARSGARDQIDHPPGGHDDLCNVVAGVQVLCSDGAQTIWQRPWGVAEKRPKEAISGSAIGYAALVNANRRRLR